MRNWERPMVVVDTFAANEFVSTCGENHKVYNFECNAGEKNKHYDVFTADGHNLTPDEGFWIFKTPGYYHPCGKEHEASVTDDFYDGYVSTYSYEGTPMFGGHWVEKRTPVIVWRGENGRNGHATTNLDMSEWTTARS